MKQRLWRSRVLLRSSLALMTLCSLTVMSAARADDPLGPYIGAAFGQAHIRAQLPESLLGPAAEFDATHSAFQGMLGARPLSFIGAEITYMDFGQASLGNPAGAGDVQLPLPGAGPQLAAVQVSQKGEAAFAVLYLPVPVIDVYVKAGLSRITTDASATYLLPGVGTCAVDNPNCGVQTVRRSSTDVSAAYGGGLQWKLGNWAVRGEYVRFSAAGANPTLFSIGMTYWPSL